MMKQLVGENCMTYLGSANRLTIHEYFISIALLAAKRSTCARRQVGCVLVDESNHVLSTGYNGVSKNMTHCIDAPCKGASAKSGKDLELCNAIHAEINAIAHCTNPKQIHSAYISVSPCIHCLKALLATPCENLYFAEKYSHWESLQLWILDGRNFKTINI